MGVRTPNLPLASSLLEIIGNEEISPGGPRRTARYPVPQASSLLEVLGIEELSPGGPTRIARVPVADFFPSDPVSRIRLAAPAHFYLDPNGDDAAGDGSELNPWKTTQKAYNTLIANYDLAGFPVTIHLADGTYSGGCLAFGKCVGQTSFHDIHFTGNEANPANVIVQKAGPPPTDFYCFAAAFGAQIKITGMKLQQGPTGAQDLVQAASQSVVGIGNVIFGDSINEWTDLIAYDGGIIYVIGDYKIDKTFFGATGNFTNGSNVISNVSSFAGIKLWQGVLAPGKAALDSWVTAINPGAGTVTMSKPAVADGTGTTIAFLNGGVCHCTVGRNGVIDYQTNGDPTVRTVEIVGLCAYFQGFQYCNGGRMDIQAVNWINPDFVLAHPVTARALGVCDNYREGVGGHYPPGIFYFLTAASFTAGDESITLAGATNIKAGQFINGLVDISAGLTNGSNIIVVASIAHIEGGCKVWGDGIPASADVVGISGSGPYNLTLSHPAKLTGTRTVRITGCGVRNGTYIRKLIGTTCYLSQPAVSTRSGIQIACGGLQESGGVLV
jgi:hypothetical protein